MGGIGNQMFQYAFGQLQKYTTGVEVGYDISWFKVLPKNCTPRSFGLDRFNVQIQFSKFLNQRIFQEKEVWDDSWLKLKEGNFVGYWQFIDSYLPILSQLQTSFQLKEELYTEDYLRLRKQIKSGKSVSLHVRRGDYLTTPGFSVIPLRYYFDALWETEGDVFIFSDDIAWCKDHFKQEYFTRKITFVDLEECSSLDLMSLCDHNIIANSSFSSWGAFLNPNPNKVVIAPNDWTPLETNRAKEKKRHLPKEWIKL